MLVLFVYCGVVLCLCVTCVCCVFVCVVIFAMSFGCGGLLVGWLFVVCSCCLFVLFVYVGIVLCLFVVCAWFVVVCVVCCVCNVFFFVFAVVLRVSLMCDV